VVLAALALVVFGAIECPPPSITLNLTFFSPLIGHLFFAVYRPKGDVDRTKPSFNQFQHAHDGVALDLTLLKSHHFF